MCTVHMARDAQKRTISLEVKGHAGYAEKGKDVVCAGISVLTQAFAAVAQKMETGGDLVSCAGLIRAGDAAVFCECIDDGAYMALELALGVVKIGFEQIAGEYPAYIKVTCE